MDFLDRFRSPKPKVTEVSEEDVKQNFLVHVLISSSVDANMKIRNPLFYEDFPDEDSVEEFAHHLYLEYKDKLKSEQ